MNPWKLLDRAQMPGSEEELRLYQRDTEFSIKAGNYELMNSRIHGSEDALANLACQKITKHARARVLIGGLGMGYTVRSALDGLGTKAQVVVAELVPAVVKWNREFLADLAGNLFADEAQERGAVSVARFHGFAGAVRPQAIARVAIDAALAEEEDARVSRADVDHQGIARLHAGHVLEPSTGLEVDEAGHLPVVEHLEVEPAGDVEPVEEDLHVLSFG